MGDLIDIAELIVSRFFALLWFCCAVFHAMRGQYDASIAFGVLALYARSLVKEERRGLAQGEQAPRREDVGGVVLV